VMQWRYPGADRRARDAGGDRAVRAVRGVRGEHGTAIVEMTWLGLLLLLPLVYVVSAVFTVQRSAYGATDAVRAAARAFVLAPDVETARQRAVEAAALSMRDQGVRVSPADIVIACRPTPTSCLTPGSSVEVEIRLDVELPLAPSLFGRAAAAIAVHASHIERYSSFRESSR
jgi:Flp pilus assembly protein TadG